jgi:hypothetical protein
VQCCKNATWKLVSGHRQTRSSHRAATLRSTTLRLLPQPQLLLVVASLGTKQRQHRACLRNRIRRERADNACAGPVGQHGALVAARLLVGGLQRRRDRRALHPMQCSHARSHSYVSLFPASPSSSGAKIPPGQRVIIRRTRHWRRRFCVCRGSHRHRDGSDARCSFALLGFWFERQGRLSEMVG